MIQRITAILVVFLVSCISQYIAIFFPVFGLINVAFSRIWLFRGPSHTFPSGANQKKLCVCVYAVNFSTRLIETEATDTQRPLLLF